MRVFVTGASGFIGRNVLPLLTGHQVLCLTRDKEQLRGLPFGALIEGDLGRSETWEYQLAAFAPQCCIHLAWEGLPDYSLMRCRRNLDLSLRLLGILLRLGVKRLVVAGTCWEYGVASGAASESQRPSACSLFAATKNALRMVLDGAANDALLEYRWARIFFAYGPGQRSEALIPTCRRAFTNGEVPRLRQPRRAQDFIHVDDVARGTVALTECDTPSGIYNIGSGRLSSSAEVANHVAAYFGASPPYSDTGYDAGLYADTAKIAAATGWQARTALTEGIVRTLRAMDHATA
jgi:UDP-glucose 4-epimerase